MILYFTGALLIGFMLFKLGTYATIIAIMTTGTKVMAALLLVSAIFLLYRKFIRKPQLPRLPGARVSKCGKST